MKRILGIMEREIPAHWQQGPMAAAVCLWIKFLIHSIDPPPQALSFIIFFYDVREYLGVQAGRQLRGDRLSRAVYP